MYSMLDVLGCSRILWKFTRGAFSNAKTYINVINPTPTTLHYYWLLWRGIRHWIFALKNLSVIASMVWALRIIFKNGWGGGRRELSNCHRASKILYEIIAVCLFARTGAHKTSGSRFPRSHIMFTLVLQILEQKRDCRSLRVTKS